MYFYICDNINKTNTGDRQFFKQVMHLNLMLIDPFWMIHVGHVLRNRSYTIVFINKVSEDPLNAT